MSRRIALSVLGLVVALSAGVLATQQARDVSRQQMAAADTATIAGVILDGKPQPQPVRRAIVTLSGAEVSGGRTAVSDEEGRFVLDRLPAGRFDIKATKPAHVTGAYGATRPGGPGVPLQLAAGQRLTNVNITLAPGAVITGRVRTTAGEPAADIQVAIFRMPPPGLATTLQAAGMTVSDDRGTYRAYGLPPGTYLVASMMKFGARNDDIDIAATAEVDRKFSELQRRTGLATGPPPAPVGPAPVAPGTYAYAPVYYPGSAATDGAQPITLAIGEERAGVDLTIGYTRMASLAGTVVTPDGGTPAVEIAINPTGVRLQALLGPTPTNTMSSGSTTRSFKYTNVAPGRYTVTARTRTAPLLWAAQTDIIVNGDDVSGINLVLQQAPRITGRIVFDRTTLAYPDDLTQMSLTLFAANEVGLAVSGYTRIGSFRIPAAVVDDAGRFEFTGVIPETYRLISTVPGPSGWWLRSAVVNGRDILDHLLELAPASGDITGAVFTFSDRHTALSGVLRNAANDVAPGYYIAVFPADRSLWRPGSRRIVSARAGTDGRWVVKDLPPGDYLIAGLTDLGADDLRDVAVLDAIAGSAVKVTLTDGEQKTQDLRIGSARQP